MHGWNFQCSADAQLATGIDVGLLIVASETLTALEHDEWEPLIESGFLALLPDEPALTGENRTNGKR